MNSPAFARAFEAITARAFEEVLTASVDQITPTVLKLQAIKAVREELQATADDLKVLHGTT